MKKSHRQILVVVLVAGGTMLSLASASAGVSCHGIKASAIGQDLGGNPIHTQAQVRGGGLLQGYTDGSLTPIVPPVLFPVIGFTGPIVFTTKQGTLTVNVTGGVDVSTGSFGGTGLVVASTGKLAGATGELTFEGVENLSNGSFVETITGEICVNLAP